ncbi:MAG: GspE/PulE family protein [Gammaproteobacteria bacterium]
MTARSISKQPLGKLLLDKGLITASDLDKALYVQSQMGGRLGAILIRIGALSEDAILPILSEQLDMPLLNLKDLPGNARQMSEWLNNTGLEIDWWLDQEVLAWEAREKVIQCVARDPLNNSIREVLEKTFPDTLLEWLLIRNHDLDQLLDRISRIETTEGAQNNTGYLRELAEEAPVIEFVNNLLAMAFDQRASDIHIEPERYIVKVRLRIDSILYERFTLPIERFSAIASRIKLISGMDIAEHRLPQDGQIETRVSGEDLDVRVSALPGVHGESLVMRLLPKEKQKFNLDILGFQPQNLDNLKAWANQPHGIILVTGPTGSGKSTTLYSVLDSINNGERKIITVEDPVEYRLPGITQVQTLDAIGYNFARALRAILRQDPDVIMIGEIRDRETAEIAIQSSLTGHLVLSTLHTNDAISAFTRLIDMGIDPFLVATPVRAVMAQRLVRRLCKHCATEGNPVIDIRATTEQILPGFLVDQQPLWREPVGCKFCQGTGFTGRIGIHELVPVSPELQHAIAQGGSTAELQQIAVQQGFKSLRDDGFIKAYQGITSIEEVLRVTAS